MTLPTVCVLAGGLGSRLGSQVASVPKPIVEVAGRPFLLHQLELLAAHGADHVVMCVGYRGEQIEEVIGASRYGIEIEYAYDGAELQGTLGAVRAAAPRLGQRFLVLYGDTYLRVDYQAVDRGWRSSGLPALMTVLHNKGRWDVSNAVYEEGLVTRYDKRVPLPSMEWIDYGLTGLTADAVGLVDHGRSDLADLHQVLAERRLLYGYVATERFYEIGTAEALAETDRFLRSASHARP